MSERAKVLWRIKEKKLGKPFIKLLIAKLDLDIQVFEEALIELISAPDAIIIETAYQVEIEAQTTKNEKLSELFVDLLLRLRLILTV